MSYPNIFKKLLLDINFSGNTISVKRADESVQTFTIPNFTGATASAAGKAGLAPAPAAGKQASFLRGDGTWQVPTDTKYSVVTASANGLMSSDMLSKLNGIQSKATAVSVARSATSGTKIATITVNGNANEIFVPDATTSAKGAVQLSSVTNSTSETLAATAKAVKAAYDLANTANTKAGNAWVAKDATTGQKGIVQLTSAVNSSSETLAATANAVKAAYDLANTANTKAGSAASTSKAGIVQLTSATNSTSETLAATAKAVKAAYDLANTANTKAGSAWVAKDASTSQKGIVQLTSATNSTSETLAATAKAVKAAYDLANEAKSASGTVAASTSTAGVVQLSSAINSTSETLAATAKAVKTAYDLANTAKTASTTTNKNATLAWNTSVTLATVGSVNITAKLPANPNNGNLKCIEFNEVSSSDNNGGYIDFHFKGDTSDYTSRIIESESGVVSINNINLRKNKTITGWSSLFGNNPDVVKGTNPTAAKYISFTFNDKNGTDVKNRLGMVETTVGTDGKVSTRLSAYKYAADSTDSGSIAIHCASDGTVYTEAPTPANGDSSTKIATTAWVKNNTCNIFGDMVALSGTEIDVSTGSVFSKTITAKTDFTIIGVPSNKAATFSLILKNGGAYQVDWPASVKWAGSSKPVLTESGTDVLTFLTGNGGTTWYGVVSSLGA